MKKIFALFGALCVLTCSFTGCSDGDSSISVAEEGYNESYDSYADEDYEESEDCADADESDYGVDSTTQVDLEVTEEKLVYTGYFDIETLDYDTTVAQIKKDIGTYKGFTETSNETDDNYDWYEDTEDAEEQNRNLYMVVRIPTESYGEFTEGMTTYGQITSSSEEVENVSKQYNDISAQIEALEKEETRLLEMMDAAETIDEMITVEERLTTVQSELNQYRTSKSELDTEITYSTITLNIDEVHQYSEPVVEDPTFGARLKETIKESFVGFLVFLQEILLFFVKMLPYILMIAVLTIIILAIILICGKHKKNTQKPVAPIPTPTDNQTKKQ